MLFTNISRNEDLESLTNLFLFFWEPHCFSIAQLFKGLDEVKEEDSVTEMAWIGEVWFLHGFHVLKCF